MTLIDKLQAAEVGSSDYRLILACYRSGQISSRQWQEHMRDEVFAAWVQRQNCQNGRG